MERLLSQIKTLYEKKNYEHALECGYEYLNQRSNDVEVMRLVSQILESLGRVNEAINMITNVLEISDVKEPCDFFARGRWLLKLSKISDAIEDFESILCISNEIGDHYYTDTTRIFLTYALAKMMRYEEAKVQLALLEDDFIIYVNKNRVDRKYLEQILA